MLKTGRNLLLAALLMVPAQGYASSQSREILQLDADVITLSQQVRVLQSSVDRVDQNNALLKGLVEKVTDQVNNLSASLQKMSEAIDRLSSRGENTSAEVRTILTNLGNHVNELQSNVNELQGGLTAVQSQIGSVSDQITAAKTTAQPLPGPEDLMRSAAVDALAGNYDLAVSDYMDFLSKYPASPRAADAHFGLAETYFNQKKYAQAAVEYDFFLQNYPGNERTLSALYKKGIAQAAINDLQPAIDTLNQVIKTYPNTVEATNAKLKLRELRRARTELIR